jgi:hypothetical protein
VLHRKPRAACALCYAELSSRSQKLKERKKTKGIKLDKKKRDDDIVVSLGPLDKLRDAIVVPPRQLIFQRLFVYAFLVVWSLYQAAASGPAFQVAVANMEAKAKTDATVSGLTAGGKSGR